MRQAGTLPSEEQARAFCDYLLTKGIESRADLDDESWVVWIFDEEELDRARRELNKFALDPTSDRYRASGAAAHEIRKKVKRDAAQARKKFVDVRKQWNRSAGAQGRPLTSALMVITVIVGFATNLSIGRGPVADWLYTSVPHILSGQVWRLVTPIFLHEGLMHIGFNMYMLYYLGGVIEARRGTTKLILLVLTSAIISNLAQYFSTDFLFGGMSGVNYALFGYIWMKGRFDPNSGMALSQGTVVILLGWLVLGFTGFMNMANGAHLGGLLVGVAAGAAPRLLRPKS